MLTLILHAQKFTPIVELGPINNGLAYNWVYAKWLWIFSPHAYPLLFALRHKSYLQMWSQQPQPFCRTTGGHRHNILCSCVPLIACSLYVLPDHWLLSLRNWKAIVQLLTSMLFQAILQTQYFMVICAFHCLQPLSFTKLLTPVLKNAKGL